MRSFEFDKSYEEIEVAGKTYRVDFSDDKRKEYIEELNRFHKRFKELEKVDEEKLEHTEALEHFEEIKKITREVVDVLLEKGSFDQLYEESGRSILNMFKFVQYLHEVIEDYNSSELEDKRKQYVKKPVEK